MEARSWEIVGVVGDTRGRGMAAGAEPEIYMTLEQDPDRWNQLFLLVRTAGNPSLMLPTVRRLIAAIDREQPVYAIRRSRSAFAETTAQHRISTILLAVFAGLAVVLAALGVYAVMAQSVAARRQEIGIRMALGAASGDVVRMITGQALRLLLIGAGIGLAGGIALGRVASSLLVGTSPSDPTVLGIVTAGCWSRLALPPAGCPRTSRQPDRSRRRRCGLNDDAVRFAPVSLKDPRLLRIRRIKARGNC